MAKWEKKCKPDPLIKNLKESCSVNNEGNVQFSGFAIMADAPKLEAMIHLNQEITLEDKHGIVQQAIFNMGRKNNLSSKTILMTEIKKLEREFLASPQQNYVLSTSISLNSFHHMLPNMQINKNRITFTTCLPRSFTRSIREQDRVASFLSGKKLPSQYLRARIAVRAKGIHQATEVALSSLNFFRALLNYRLNFGQQSFSFGGTSRKPINKILLGLSIPHSLNSCNWRV